MPDPLPGSFCLIVSPKIEGGLRLRANGNGSVTFGSSLENDDKLDRTPGLLYSKVANCSENEKMYNVFVRHHTGHACKIF